MLSFVLFTVIPILGLFLMFCFDSGNTHLKPIGWVGLVCSAILLTWEYDFWSGLILITTFIFNMFARIAYKNRKISIKNACREFLFNLNIFSQKTNKPNLKCWGGKK